MSNQIKFVLFTNKNKKEDKHPDYQGNAERDGKKFEAAAWVHTDKNGKKYLSGQINFDKEIAAKDATAQTLE